MDEERLPPAGGVPPLVEAIRRDDAPPPREGFPECPARQQRLLASVDVPRRTGGARRPVRDQSPAVRPDRPSPITLDDDRSRIRRRDVVAATRVVGQGLGLEDVGELGVRSFLIKTPEHSAGDGAGGIVARGGDSPGAKFY